MELKSFQQRVIADVSDFLACIEKEPRFDQAFVNYWREKGILAPTPYQNFVPRAPHVCIKGRCRSNDI